MIADETGQALALGIGGPGNYEVVGYRGLADTLNGIVDQALTAADISKGQLAGAGFGVAGYDWPTEREPTLEAIQALGLSAPFEFVNDSIKPELDRPAGSWNARGAPETRARPAR